MKLSENRIITTMRIKEGNEEYRNIEIYEDDVFEFNYGFNGGSVIPRLAAFFYY
jgi:hypothetical protein